LTGVQSDIPAAQISDGRHSLARNEKHFAVNRVQSDIPAATISDGRHSLAKNENHFAVNRGTER
jgi:hypothetical protein